MISRGWTHKNHSRSFPSNSGIILAHSRVILGSFRIIPGAIRKSFWIIPGSFLAHSESFPGHSWSFLGHSKSFTGRSGSFASHSWVIPAYSKVIPGSFQIIPEPFMDHSWVTLRSFWVIPDHPTKTKWEGVNLFWVEVGRYTPPFLLRIPLRGLDFYEKRMGCIPHKCRQGNLPSRGLPRVADQDMKLPSDSDRLMLSTSGTDRVEAGTVVFGGYPLDFL